MVNITEMLLTNSNRPKKKLVQLKGIVVHWTANTNKGANAAANRNYFNSTTTAASAHYIVDDKQIIRCVPDDEVAYHVGAKRYTNLGNKIRSGNYTPNYYLVGIEMCVNSDGNWDQTYKNTVELVKYLMDKYDLGIDKVYRHYDITGKECPKMMIEEKAWNDFKNEVLKDSQNNAPKDPNKVKIVVDGKYIDTEPIINNNTTYVPIRVIANALKASVDWDAATKTVIVKSNSL